MTLSGAGTVDPSEVLARVNAQAEQVYKLFRHPSTTEEILLEIQRILIDPLFDLSSDQITLNSKLEENLRLDRSKHTILAIGIEVRFGIEISDNEVQSLITVSDLVSCIQGKVEAKASRLDYQSASKRMLQFFDS